MNPISASDLPAMSSEAYLTMGWPTAFATKGTVRDARGLASMMYTFSRQQTALATTTLLLQLACYMSQGTCQPHKM